MNLDGMAGLRQKVFTLRDRLMILEHGPNVSRSHCLLADKFEIIGAKQEVHALENEYLHWLRRGR